MIRILRTAVTAGLCLAALSGGVRAGGGGPPLTRTYTNPVINENFPDPFVLRAGGWYYAYATNGNGSDVPVQRSRDLVHWSFVGNALAGQPSWASGGLTWAPEVMAFAPNRYVLYYTTHDLDSDRQCISAAVASSPDGPFTDASDRPVVCQVDLGGSIDPSPFRDTDGQRYLLWKNDGNCCGQSTGIYLQKLSADGLTLVGSARRLISNDRAWEGAVIEAPTLHVQGGVYYLLYSGGSYDNGSYAVGYATARSLGGPYTKAAEPLVVTHGRVVGPGHQTVLRDGAGQTWLVYHAWTLGAVGDAVGGERSMRLDRVTFRDGKVVFGGVTLTPQPAPVP